MLIAESFLKEFARKHGRQLEGLSEAAKKLLVCYNWPGNVRELQNVIERAVIMTVKGKWIEPAALPLEIQNYYAEQGGTMPAAEAEPAAASTGPAASDSPAENVPARILDRSEDLSLATVERELLLECLQRCDGNRTEAAKMMGVSIRTLRNKLSQYKEEARTEFERF